MDHHKTEFKNKIRFVTATALFDGHDASINIFRRLLQQSGCEVIHLGHNRSVQEIATAAVQEDAQGICVSSYQGGHMEFFSYLREVLDTAGRPDIKLFGGGGGVILHQEIAALQEKGISRIYTPQDGLEMGLQGIILDILQKSDFNTTEQFQFSDFQNNLSHLTFAKALSCIEKKDKKFLKELQSQKSKSDQKKLVLGITGTGGSGKSSLTDELVHRVLLDFPQAALALFCIDPSKKKSGGALLGDRIRYNAIDHKNVFMRSFATRNSKKEICESLEDALLAAQSLPFDLIIVETSGIGQGDTGILDYSDLSLYVMTSEFGASSQLEKIDMLDFANFIAINKFDRKGSEDAFREVAATLRRSRYQGDREKPISDFPIFGTIAAKFNDDGVNALYQKIIHTLREKEPQKWHFKKPSYFEQCSQMSQFVAPIIPQNRVQYLSEISETVRKYHRKTQASCAQLKVWESFENLEHYDSKNNFSADKKSLQDKIGAETFQFLADGEQRIQEKSGEEFTYTVRGKEYKIPLKTISLSGNRIPKLALPNFLTKTDLYQFLRKENFPGYFPFTGGLFPFKRTDEDPKRQFAGEGGPKRTNQRFHFLTQGEKAKRLSTAFDSVTLYGFEPSQRPDIFGKVGESGVSIATLQDMKDLYAGFDLCDTNTSVSMTINGPAPIILAFFFNTAIDFSVDKFQREQSRAPSESEWSSLKQDTLKKVRGTVQADILKEDQAQNTCIFSVDFSLKLMGDMQEYFIQNQVRNYYSVSVSGYHIAEAGANPISQLAFTLANGFTYVEYYLSRGMNIDDFAPNLAFFFSNGMDPEYGVIGRVARRIWAIAMKEKYGASERSQKLKYHIQTSGRSLHAQEMDFNDIRTTLQALIALNDQCNSLHTNAYDEAITTPTEESVRRSMAIQMILTKEFGLLKNENSLQGSFFIDELTDLVEEAVLKEFEKISARGGVLGAMETQYQRSKIQEESLYYEQLKHSGELPLVGVNTFLNPNQNEVFKTPKSLSRSSQNEKNEQLSRLQIFQSEHKINCKNALENLKKVAINDGNIFEELLETTRHASLGQITGTLFELGGKFRRNL